MNQLSQDQEASPATRVHPETKAHPETWDHPAVWDRPAEPATNRRFGSAFDTFDTTDGGRGTRFHLPRRYAVQYGSVTVGRNRVSPSL